MNPITNSEIPDQLDVLMDRARQLILEGENPSVAYLQRHLLIGYNRATRMMQSLEGDLVTSLGASGWRQMLHSAKRSPDDPLSPEFISDE